MAHDDEREQGYDTSRATPDGVVVVAAFAAVLVGLTWVAVGQQVAGVVHMLDMFGDIAWPCRPWKVDSGQE